LTLAEASLIETVESGVFTPEQHKTFMQRVIQVFGGVED
jgi:hypothetical protein